MNRHFSARYIMLDNWPTVTRFFNCHSVILLLRSNFVFEFRAIDNLSKCFLNTPFINNFTNFDSLKYLKSKTNQCMLCMTMCIFKADVTVRLTTKNKLRSRYETIERRQLFRSSDCWPAPRSVFRSYVLENMQVTNTLYADIKRHWQNASKLSVL